ncbi:hypothetical protein HPB50_014903 [Hyalomma asiaticum]|uniref:Uncharacterized protein n=1 Tax=Hyalomma asiaticum TaxID=266040 RepID=A0ACB7S2N2_HYAAI|nr:hypothetical protein HPB50_014903 [Hyalomma asiaticum]
MVLAILFLEDPSSCPSAFLVSLRMHVLWDGGTLRSVVQPQILGGPVVAPPLYCHLTATNVDDVSVKAKGASNKGQKIPPPGQCDVIILSIAQEPNGDYDESQYNFVMASSANTMLLFTLSWKSSNLDLLGVLRTLQFQDVAWKLYNKVRCRGFGVIVYRNDNFDAPRLVNIFKELKSAVIAVGYRTPQLTTFMMLHPEPQDNQTVRDGIITIMPYLSLLVLVPMWAPTPERYVQCIASWNNAGFKDTRQLTYERAIDIIKTLPKGNTKFALTITLAELYFHFVADVSTMGETRAFPVGRSYGGYVDFKLFDTHFHLLCPRRSRVQFNIPREY